MNWLQLLNYEDLLLFSTLGFWTVRPHFDLILSLIEKLISRLTDYKK